MSRIIDIALDTLRTIEAEAPPEYSAKLLRVIFDVENEVERLKRQAEMWEWVAEHKGKCVSCPFWFHGTIAFAPRCDADTHGHETCVDALKAQWLADHPEGGER